MIKFKPIKNIRHNYNLIHYNFNDFTQWMVGQSDSKVASIATIQSPLNFLLTQILINCCHSQLSELWSIFKQCVFYFYCKILTCILVIRRQHVYGFLYVYFWINVLSNVN
jgi:hypothetical protein